MSFDLDRYYTPPDVARNALEKAELSYIPRVCADSTCGTGHLLNAANEVFGSLQCIGIDRDKQTIAELRQRNPNWALAVGNLLSKHSYKKSISAVIPEKVDLLVLNPPFSHGKRKSVEIAYGGQKFKGSVAMAHLLKSFELFKPSQGAVVIVPESLLYSETDLLARSVLAESYSFRKITDLESSTFHGTRANASIVQICQAELEDTPKETLRPTKKIEIFITRGSLPVHMMSCNPKGVPFIHSTDIRGIVEGLDTNNFLKTTDMSKGRITGWTILIPRVGMPERLLLRKVCFKSTVQLSDCVIALRCSNKAAAQAVELRIQASWDEFKNLYKGTGARYVTIARLRAWLANRNICDVAEVAS